MVGTSLALGERSRHWAGQKRGSAGPSNDDPKRPQIDQQRGPLSGAPDDGQRVSVGRGEREEKKRPARQATGVTFPARLALLLSPCPWDGSPLSLPQADWRRCASLLLSG